MKPALAVMARAPVPGLVKTRLLPALGPEDCATLYRAFLADTLALASSLPVFETCLAYTPAGSAHLFSEFAMRGVVLMPQPEGDLGQRMSQLLKELAVRHNPVLLIGSDIPTLQPRTLLQALAVLKSHDLCLGPCRDGGYYLVGARHSCPPIFSDIPWSTAGVLQMTLARAEQAGLSFALLDEYRDVDVPADLAELRRGVLSLQLSPGATLPCRTSAWLARHKEIKK